MRTSNVKFIAEIGSNHNADFKRALKLVDAAHAVGCDAVKFQLFRADLLHRDPEAREQARPRELPPEWISPLQEKVHSLGMEFGLSAFYLGASEDAEPDFWKISSYEANWWALVVELKGCSKILLVSTGLLDVVELDELRWHLGGCNYALLHSVSLYPTPIEKANLSRIDLLKKYSPKVGYSDHTTRKECIERAVLHYKVGWVEFHLDLPDAKGWEAAHSWDPGMIKERISVCRMDFCDQDTSERAHVRKGGLRG